MPESGIDVTPKAYEVIHNLPYTIIANLTARDPQEALEVAHQMKNGIPSSWHIYDNKTHLVTDSGSPYFVKYKSYPPPKFESRLDREYYTVMNEISLSPRIREFLEGRAGIELANSYGFSEVHYVEPLAGSINQKTRQKALVYRKIKGRAPNKVLVHGKDLSKLARAINLGLKGVGVGAYDLNYWQFLLPDDKSDKKIYLVDAEEFSSVEPTSG